MLRVLYEKNDLCKLLIYSLGFPFNYAFISRNKKYIRFDALGHIVTALLKSRHECRTLNEYNALLVPNKQLFSIEVCGIYKLSY